MKVMDRYQEKKEVALYLSQKEIKRENYSGKSLNITVRFGVKDTSFNSKTETYCNGSNTSIENLQFYHYRDLEKEENPYQYQNLVHSDGYHKELKDLEKTVKQMKAFSKFSCPIENPTFGQWISLFMDHFKIKSGFFSDGNGSLYSESKMIEFNAKDFGKEIDKEISKIVEETKPKKETENAIN